MRSALKKRLPYRLTSWLTHTRNYRAYRRMRREVTTVEEEIRRSARSDGIEVPSEGRSRRQGELRSYHRYTLRDFDRHKCIFVHVPKAAGISVATGLFGHLAGGHRTVRAYRRIFGWDFDRYFVFTVVRNPYSRLVSAYNFMMGEHPVFRLNAVYRDTVLAEYSGFEEFVVHELRTAASEFIVFRPQTHFLCADERIDVDFVGTVENLEEDFLRICECLDVEASLPHRNRTAGPRKPVKDYFSEPKVADEVRSVYEADFEVLGYRRDVPER